jgi:hypothetical protein
LPRPLKKHTQRVRLISGSGTPPGSGIPAKICKKEEGTFYTEHSLCEAKLDWCAAQVWREKDELGKDTEVRIIT